MDSTKAIASLAAANNLILMMLITQLSEAGVISADAFADMLTQLAESVESNPGGEPAEATALHAGIHRNLAELLKGDPKPGWTPVVITGGSDAP